MKTQVTVKSVGVLPLLGVLFVALKLTHFIDWSWWWVTAPFWGGFVAVMAFIAIAFLVAFVVLLVNSGKLD